VIEGGWVRADTDAQFREFVAARQAALLSTACLLAGDWASGEDLLQTALTKTYLAWPRIRDKAAVEAYVRKTMTRTAISWWRRRWKAEQPTAEPPEVVVRDHTELTDNRDLVLQALRTLPAAQRAVLVLRFHADLTEAQAADALGITVGTVKSQTSRALAKLRVQLAADRELAVGGGR
jgi:RNA polymerase sigma-70 factor (sigma-E family)